MLRLRRYERLSVQNRRFRSNGGRLIQNFRYKGSPPPFILFSQKTRINALSFGIKIWTDFSFVLCLTDRRTERQTEFSTLDRVCIPGSAVKMEKWDKLTNTRHKYKKEYLLTEVRKVVEICYEGHREHFLPVMTLSLK